MWLLSAKITIDCVEKLAKLSSTKLISLLIRQTLIPPNFRHLWYNNIKYLIVGIDTKEHGIPLLNIRNTLPEKTEWIGIFILHLH